jgi:hypothetical protein
VPPVEPELELELEQAQLPEAVSQWRPPQSASAAQGLAVLQRPSARSQ